MSLDDLTSAFCLSASAYYAPFTFPQALDPLPTYAPRTPLHDQPGLADPNEKHTPTTSRMTPEELRETTHPRVIDAEGSQNLLRILNPDIYKANVESALLDRRFAFGNTLEEVWPSLRVHVIWSDMSVGDCVWASVLLKFMHAEAQPEFRRPLALRKLEGANHFVSVSLRAVRVKADVTDSRLFLVTGALGRARAVCEAAGRHCLRLSSRISESESESSTRRTRIGEVRASGYDLVTDRIAKGWNAFIVPFRGSFTVGMENCCAL